MKKIGILGGSFNPPHVAHVLLAEQVKTQLQLDEVWFMPSAIPPHIKKKTTIAGHHRLAMVQLAIQQNVAFKLETIELDQGGVNYTVDTMKQLTKKHPDKTFYFIIGGDMVEDLPNWHCVDDLMTLVTFVAVNRPETRLESPYPLIRLTVPNMAISSTFIRESVAKQRSIRYLVDDAVGEYIIEKGLYQDVN